MSKTINNDPSDVCLSFGEPEPVRFENILEYAGMNIYEDMEYFYPPIAPGNLALIRRLNVHHGSCLLFRRNMASIAYLNGGLSKKEMMNIFSDYLTFGNAYIYKHINSLGRIVKLQHIPGVNMRIRTKGEGYRLLTSYNQYIDFKPSEIFHVAEYDETQQIYGMPDWLSGLHSALLNNEATLFRRRFYKNGSHIGYILYTSDSKINKDVQEKLRDKFRDGKGVGNFKSFYIHIPNGTKEAIQAIPIGDINQKDDFEKIKSVSQADVQIAHRVPPALLGIVPSGTSTFGNPETASKVYLATETRALCQNFIDLNRELPSDLQFKFIDFDKLLEAKSS